MSIGPFYTNQVPASVLGLSVVDGSGTAIDLTGYTSASLVLQDPTGTDVDTSGGTCTITNAVAGEVTYDWPSTSLFTFHGTYQIQLVLKGPNGTNDLAVIQDILVKRAL